jgi:hypothetical protein
MNLITCCFLVAMLSVPATFGFVPRSCTMKTISIYETTSSTKQFINIGDQERDKLTRDSEPGEYFKT